MANQNYDQLAELVASGKLNWTGDLITAFLGEGVVFNAADTKLSALGVSFPPSRRAIITGRTMSGRNALGAAVIFNDVGAQIDFQVLVTQDDGAGDANLLAFLDVDNEAQPLSVENPGSLIVRPVALDPENPEAPPTTGVWLQF
jgi:hypothetical protein